LAKWITTLQHFTIISSKQ